jgi:EAL domain-containing protein (putative c-di-GMP-specific phosphodiesterase class I)
MVIQLSIDDFGIGYSSLSRRHNLPISVLKFDCSFISKMSWSLRNIGIVEAIVTSESAEALIVSSPQF